MNQILAKCLFILFLITVSLFSGCSSNNSPTLEAIETDVLVIGGGTGGTAAAIQAARSYADVILVESTPWLGGMLTTAGVSATDGNHRLPSGIWGEFRQKLYEHYGGPEAVATGWVSNTQFEPHVGNQIWERMADQEKTLRRMHGYWVEEVIREGSTVRGAVFQNEAGEQMRVNAKVVIDATELGDVIALSGAAWRAGQDPKSLTGEEFAPEEVNDFVQDLTYVAILKDYGTDKTIPRPESYDPSVFDCMCAELCSQPDENMVSCDKMLEYGRLPGNKYMINWPNKGNDFYANILEMTREERLRVYEKAKEHTLNCVYFLQTEGGYSHLGIAEDEYPTDDNLPFIPYHRESRRLQGVVFLTVSDLQDPYADTTRPYYKTAVAVGDYPLDHHHDQNERSPKEIFPAIPSFSVPYECLVPESIDGLLVADKNISVSHAANGSTRLQPCVILIGQAAGTAAALAARKNIVPREVPVRELQSQLLEAGCWLLPFIDTQPSDWHFEPLQKMGATGIFKGHGVPYQWANQTWIYPDSMVSGAEFASAIHIATDGRLKSEETKNDPMLSRSWTIKYLWSSINRPQAMKEAPDYMGLDDEILRQAMSYFREQGWTRPWSDANTDQLDEPLVRKELAYLIDKIYDPFNQLPLEMITVDHEAISQE